MPKFHTLRRGVLRSLPLYPRQILLCCGLGVILRVALPYLTIRLPQVVLDSIAAGVDSTVFFLRVGGLALVLVALNYAKGFTDHMVNQGTGTTASCAVLRLEMDKYMTMDFDLMQSAEFKARDEKLQQATSQGNHSPAMNIPRTLTELLANVGGFVLYAAAIAVVHPLMLPVLAVTAAVNWAMLSRAQRYDAATRAARGAHFDRFRALRETLQDPASAKDLRLYRAAGWLLTVYRREYDGYLAAEDKNLVKTMQTGLVAAAMLVVRDGLAYALLIGLVLSGRMGVGEFVFAFAAVGGLAGWISGALTAGAELTRACTGVCDLFDALEFPDRMNTGPGAPLPTGDALPPAVTLRGVGYRYPGAEDDTLRGLHAEIAPGERIAIVGVNGAGKTTLVKLLCGLCRPTEGEILVGGVPIGAFHRDGYYSMLSAVFQDIHLLAASVAVNVAQTTEYDPARVASCLALVGLPLDPAALLVRAVFPDALELSGGQKQKLAMARAIYKDAPMILLDEPTAALDPIAEQEIYERYAELTAGKTSFYISHRLASTRFCDRILLLDGGEIAECGTHDELIRLGGKYAEMFELQAGYYRKEAVQ